MDWRWIHPFVVDLPPLLGALSAPLVLFWEITSISEDECGNEVIPFQRHQMSGFACRRAPLQRSSQTRSSSPRETLSFFHQQPESASAQLQAERRMRSVTHLWVIVYTAVHEAAGTSDTWLVHKGDVKASHNLKCTTSCLCVLNVVKYAGDPFNGPIIIKEQPKLLKCPLTVQKRVVRIFESNTSKIRTNILTVLQTGIENFRFWREQNWVLIYDFNIKNMATKLEQNL